MIIYCSNCGKRVPDKDRHCLYCGQEVVINHNDPEAVEMTLEDLKESRLEELKAQEEAWEAEKAAREKQRIEDEALINKYEEEIKVFQRRRNIMIIPSLLLFALGIAGTIIFYTLFVRYIVDNNIIIDYASILDIFNDSIPATARVYAGLALFSSLLLEAGIILLAVVVIPCIVKIANRMKRINELRNKSLL